MLGFAFATVHRRFPKSLNKMLGFAFAMVRRRVLKIAQPNLRFIEKLPQMNADQRG
jgi:hypothetical protein